MTLRRRRANDASGRSANGGRRRDPGARSPDICAIAFALPTSAFADERVLVLSAYSPEGAVLLDAAGVDGPEDEVGVFNGRRFFAGVAGGPNIGDVVVPDRWTDGAAVHPVDSCMFAVAQGLTDVPLSPYLPIEDLACTGRTALPETPIRTETDPELVAGGLGSSADPWRAAPPTAASRASRR